MSIVDDCEGQTMAYGEFWICVYSVSHRFLAQEGALANLLAHCSDCDSCLEHWDMSHGDYGDIHCAYCGGINIDFDPDLET